MGNASLCLSSPHPNAAVPRGRPSSARVCCHTPCCPASCSGREFSRCQEHSQQTGGAGPSVSHASLTDPERMSVWKQRLGWGPAHHSGMWKACLTSECCAPTQRPGSLIHILLCAKASSSDVGPSWPRPERCDLTRRVAIPLSTHRGSGSLQSAHGLPPVWGINRVSHGSSIPFTLASWNPSCKCAVHPGGSLPSDFHSFSLLPPSSVSSSSFVRRFPSFSFCSQSSHSTNSLFSAPSSPPRSCIFSFASWVW